jgi:hypothetical protein
MVLMLSCWPLRGKGDKKTKTKIPSNIDGVLDNIYYAINPLLTKLK